MGRVGVDWYVFGAQAVVLYGRPRMTADIDITAAAGSLATRELVEHLEAAGFWLRIDLDEGFLRRTHLLPLVHRETGMPVDVVLATTEMHKELMGRRKFLEIQGLCLPVISPEDLIVTKILAGRRKDLADVRGVLNEQGDRLDRAYIERLLGELAEALAEPRLLTRFARQVRAARALRGG